MYKPQCEACSVDFMRSNYLSLICPSCGVEHFEDMWENNNVGVCNFAQLQSGYSRAARFNAYLQAVLGVNTGPANKCKIWKYLKHSWD